MQEYKTELVDSRIRKLNINIGSCRNTNSSIMINFTFRASEPVDPQDPTILITTEVAAKDVDPEKLNVVFTMETVFQFDPIPDNRTVVAKEQCCSVIQKEAIVALQRILDATGNDITLKEYK